MDKDKKLILIFGGSLGSSSINKAVRDLVKLIQDRKDWQIVHITGDEDFKEFRGISSKNYKVFTYLDNLLQIMKLSDLVVSRCGATTISEITYLGKPSVLIPYPYAINNHQMANAQVLAKAGAGIIIEDSRLNGEKLSQVMNEILHNERKLKNMSNRSKELGREDAKEKIVNEILKFIH